jgi:GNAT superfamily N-acetyltransferase
MGYIVRHLNEKDLREVKKIDSESGLDVANMLESYQYCWGIYVDGLLAGYCTIGGADCCAEPISTHNLYNKDALLLSDVYVYKEYRGHNYSIILLHRALKLYHKPNVIYLTLLDYQLSYLYNKLGFESIDKYTMFKNMGVRLCLD